MMSDAVAPLTPSTLLTIKTNTQFRGQIENGVFLFFIHKSTSEAVSFMIQSPRNSKTIIQKLLKEVEEYFLISLDQLTLKVIGTSKELKELESILFLEKIKPEKAVERTAKFEIVFTPKPGRLQIERQEAKTKILVVDDSKTIRQILEKLFSLDPSLEVVASLADPREVLDALKKFKPDVMTLDIHMPHMDGIQVLKSVLPLYPIPTVMISSISMEEGPLVLNALEAGAVDYIQKPTHNQMANVGEMIIEKVKDAAKAQVKSFKRAAGVRMITNERVSHVGSFIAIGSSTGGTEALREILIRFPESIPPVLIVQHIPAVFSKAFADRMNTLCPFEVKEAEHGDLVLPNRVFIAPGGKHMKVVKTTTAYQIEISDGEPVNRFKPSVDVLFSSVAAILGKKAVGVILTGMGADGSKGLLEMRKAGCRTIGQNQESCVVYGMPKAAFEIGAVEQEFSVEAMAQVILDLCSKKTAQTVAS